MRVALILVTASFCLFSGWLVHSACGSDANSSAEESPQLIAADTVHFNAVGGPLTTVTLGSTDPRSGFKFELELTSKGAAIKKAVFSEFDDCDYKHPQPLVILSAVKLPDDSEVLSMANKEFVFVQQQLQLPLDKLSWKTGDVEKAADGSQKVCFEAVIEDSNGQPVIKLIKTYKVIPNSYLLDCEFTIENLASTEQKVQFNLTGPVGIGKEDISRNDKKVVAGFRDSRGQIFGIRINATSFDSHKTFAEEILGGEEQKNQEFLWAAVVNKYFAAIVVPLPENGKNFCDWISGKQNQAGERGIIFKERKGLHYTFLRLITGKSYKEEVEKTGRFGRFYNPDGQSASGDENIGVGLDIDFASLRPVGQTNSSKTYRFKLYLGPKDKSLFDKSELYRKLSFVQTIDFMSCCCPVAIIQPLAFGILALMKWMYGFIGNYGVVIIILVFLMRLAMHPITKKSQVSMSKMSTLAPKAEEIKKKYANDKAEQNKQLMALYKEQGASPIMGMLPMFVQMPIWIALWSAVYTGIELRGAPFLPFWITDLSAPDALVRFSTVTIPLLGWKVDSLNLLPILMGVAFYLQQKMTPQQATTASTNPQVAQQQKMMMIMLPLLFPLMLYKAPSGVNLYIMASTFAGVIEQHVIKKHIREKEERESAGLVATTSKTGGKVKKKKPKPFFKT
jgi:YidC/Oxa1 family membrane protein insertase